MPTLTFVLGIMLLLTLIASPAEAHAPGVSLSGVGTATIDGVISAVEWDGAAQIAVFSGGTCYVMNDADNLYLALDVIDSTFSSNDLMSVRFDNDHNGIVNEGDDKVFPTTSQFRDLHFQASAAGWGTQDSQLDGSSAAASTGSTIVLRYPIL